MEGTIRRVIKVSEKEEPECINVRYKGELKGNRVSLELRIGKES